MPSPGFFKLAAALGGLSLVVMVLVDRALGPRAEFLNAWSVVERFLGRAPAAGPSAVAERAGGLGELVVVLAVNAAIGGLGAGLVHLVGRAVR